MELETQKIINLHKIDVRLQEIQEEKGDLPIIIKEQKDEISGLDSKMSESDSKINELEKEKSDCNTSVKDFEAKLDKYNKQMDMVTNNKEYDALLVEIDHLKNEKGSLVFQNYTFTFVAGRKLYDFSDCSDITEKISHNKQTSKKKH